jgi:hypothetical protein
MKKYAFFLKRKNHAYFFIGEGVFSTFMVHDVFTIVDTSLSWFQRRNQKSNSKEKANSRFLHASYTFCMTKKNLIGGWVSIGQLDERCSVVVYLLIILYLLLNGLKRQILQTWN